MARIVTVPLTLPYPFSPQDEQAMAEQALAEGMTRAEVCRKISEEMIVTAAQQCYPDGMSLQEGKMFAAIKEQLDAQQLELSLDGTQYDFLVSLFHGPTAEQRLRFRPAAARWVLTWCRALQNEASDAHE